MYTRSGHFGTARRSRTSVLNESAHARTRSKRARGTRHELRSRSRATTSRSACRPSGVYWADVSRVSSNADVCIFKKTALSLHRILAMYRRPKASVLIRVRLPTFIFLIFKRYVHTLYLFSHGSSYFILVFYFWLFFHQLMSFEWNKFAWIIYTSENIRVNGRNLHVRFSTWPPTNFRHKLPNSLFSNILYMSKTMNARLPFLLIMLLLLTGNSTGSTEIFYLDNDDPIDCNDSLKMFHILENVGALSKTTSYDFYNLKNWFFKDFRNI